MKLTVEQMQDILDKHKLWLAGEADGVRADFRGADLRGADLRNADFHGADLRFADLRNVNLRGADLRFADFSGADLRFADFRDANFRGADFRGADLRFADFSGADLDFACMPLWCGDLKARYDDRQIIQQLYHVLAHATHSVNCSKELKAALLTPELVLVANRFHRVDECGKLKNI